MVVTSGYGDSGYLSKTEILAIGNNNGQTPKYPDHPRKISGATGGFLGTIFLTCGGYDIEEGYTEKCYEIGSEGSFHSFASMMEKRKYASSIVLDDETIWILGGRSSKILSSTEYIFSDGRNEEGPPMPIALYQHAIVKINETTSFLGRGLKHTTMHHPTKTQQLIQGAIVILSPSRVTVSLMHPVFQTLG